MNFAILLFVFGLSAVVCSAQDASADDSGKFFLFAQRSTTTAYSISTSGTTILSTCFAAVTRDDCTGRRKKRFLKLERSFPSVDGEDINLDSTLSGSVTDETDIVAAKEDEDPAKQSKFLFTLWETQTSTLVVLSTSTDGVNIVSVSALCSIAGQDYPAC